MTDFRADLHCHSTCSDGSESPENVLKIAASIGLSGLSITDHDSVEAYATAFPFAEEKGIKLLPGVEFSSMHKGVSVHILAYSFNPQNPLIHEFSQKHHQRRLERNREILSRLASHGMPVSEEEIEDLLSPDLTMAQRTIGRPHIAQVMVKKRYVESITEAFRKHIGEGKPCYAAGKPFSSEETLDLIHKINGLAVIAHPHLVEEAKTLQELLQMKFDGIECYYGNFPMNLQERWLKIASKKQWLITGGSDFHGSIKPNIPLGSSWVNEQLFSPLYNHYLNNSKRQS